MKWDLTLSMLKQLSIQFLVVRLKKASSQIQIALQLFASTGKKVLQFYGNMFTDIYRLCMMYGAQCTHSSVTC
jgi:hypothetical protein